MDIKGENLIKGVKFDGLKVIGRKKKIAQCYYREGIDELIYVDAVASLYSRPPNFELVRRISKNSFRPLTVCGGIKNVDDAKAVFNNGGDKIAINTAAVENPGLVTDLVKEFGAQAVTISIEAKKIGPDNWEVYSHGGREPTGKRVIDWIKTLDTLGAGEILLTSIDNDGTFSGFDSDLCISASKVSDLPLVIGGGGGSIDDILKMTQLCRLSGIAIASAFHYKHFSIADVRNAFACINSS